MADEILIDRLKRLQEQLLAIYAETLALRAEAEKKAKERNVSEWSAFRLPQTDTR